ncbi:hypothetical protein V1514DRAFT_306875 [Lipomyces japonicus]|uniref:uncharacterized protein n=1 Tax=Lipomyces japonicus TaxID=56871 RepID=UPI0034CD8BAA
MGAQTKRKNDGGDSKRSKDRQKKIKYWKTESSTIHPGVSGIFVTCNRRFERKCRSEIMEIFNEVAESEYDLSKFDADSESDPEDEEDVDIEASIAKELDSIKKKKERKLFKPINIDCECVLFIRTKKPIDPVHIVHKVCEDAMNSGIKNTRHTLRLSPVTFTASANEEEFKKLVSKVLEPHFHQEGQEPLKFAIRPTTRNHTTFDRDYLIRTIAEAVGRPHKVDLTNYDRLILVECFKNIVGISVVEDFEKLKRFNLQQIFESTVTSKEE